MNRFLLPVLSFVLGLLFIDVQQAYASHAMGADISYECLGNGQYRIVAAFYRDCSGISEPTTLSARVNGPACGLNQTLSLAKDPNYSVIINGQLVSNGSEVSQLCNAPGVVSRCVQSSGTTFPGVRVYFYTATVTIPPNCGNVTVSINECCRNTANNLASSQSYDLFTLATLNTDIPGCNDAPVFTTLPVPYYCVNQTYTYSHGALDLNGDSLVYTLVQPLGTLTSTVPYSGQFNPNNPFPNSLFTFDVTTGTMNFRPTAVGNYVVAVRVDEYRNGVFVGNTIRDIQFVVINCNNAPPAVQSGLTNQNVTGASVTSASSISICPGVPVSFTITASDPDAQALQVTSNIAASIPGATLTTSPINGRQDSVQITFNWLPSGNDTGTRYLTLNISDKACPIEGIQIVTYEITLNRGVSVGPDRIYCVGGGPVTINATGAQNYTWEPALDFTFVSGADSSTVIVVPTATPRTYIVKGDLIGGCKDRDTIVITTANNFSVTVTADDSTICLNQSAELTVTPNPLAEGPFTYSWIPSGNVDNPQAGVTRVRPTTSTTYKVETRSKDGCVIRDSVPIFVQGLGPKVRVTPSANFVCPGTEVQLNAEIFVLETGPSQNPSDPCPGCDFVFPLPIVGSGTVSTATEPTPYRCFWHDGRVQYLYRASELIAAGMGPGVITDVQFFVVNKTSTIPYNNFTIKMGGTSLNQLPATFVTQNMFTVYQANYTTVANSWNSHSLTTPFSWDGQSNLIVEACFDNSSFIFTWDNVQYTNAFPGATLYGGVDGSQGCIINPTGSSPLRPNTRFGFAKFTPGDYNIEWSPVTGLSSDTSLKPTVTVFEDVTYSIFVSDSVCKGDTSVTLRVNPNVLIKASDDVTVCSNDTALLSALVINPQQEVCSQGYTLDSILFDLKTSSQKIEVPFSTTGTGHNRNAALQLPFDFKFFCANQNQITVNENGLIVFGAFTAAAASNTFIPSTLAPNNFVAGLWTDLNSNPAGSGNGVVTYFVTGSFPYRCFVVEWEDVLVMGSTATVTFQIQLYETSNRVEIHMNPIAANRPKTVGIENAAGNLGFFPPGRNNVNFSTTVNKAWRFNPAVQGTQLVTFEWSPNLGLDNVFGDTVSASPGVNTQYVVTAYFTDGCSTTDTVNLNITGFPYTLSASKLNLCPGESTQLSFTGNATSVQWSPTAMLTSPNQATTEATPTATTVYTVIATDATGCQVRDNITISIKANGIAKLGNDTAACYDESIVLTPTGGEPYTSYQWVPGGQTSPSLSVTETGSYFVVLSDGQCTFTSDTVEVTIHPKLALEGEDAGVCQGEELRLNAQQGLTGYLWNTGAQTSFIVVNTQGQYAYSATDQFGCRQFSDTINFSVSPLPTIQVSASKDPFCADSTSELSAGASQVDVVYSWALNSPQNVVGTGNPYGATEGGKYYVEANNKGCINSDSISIVQLIPATTVLGDDISVCSCDTSILLASFNLVSGATYEWSTGATTPSINVSASGAYSLSVTDATGCPSADEVFIQINCLTVEAKTVDRNVVTVNDTVALTADNESYEAAFEYIWQPALYLDDSTLRSPKSFSANTDTVVYTLILRDTENGCVAFDTVAVYFLPPGGFAMPSAFSPNRDGKNDRFFPYLRSPEFTKVKSLTVFNRWGQLLYSCADCNNDLPNAGWDGSFDGKEQPAGSYLFAVEIESPDESNPKVVNTVKQSGALTLIK